MPNYSRRKVKQKINVLHHFMIFTERWFMPALEKEQRKLLEKVFTVVATKTHVLNLRTALLPQTRVPLPSVKVSDITMAKVLHNSRIWDFPRLD